MTPIERLHDITVKLRDPQKGCPWDKEQTLESLKPCVLEETYELLDAMSHPEDKENHIEELGDVLLQVMFQCVMAEEKGLFSFDDVANAISDKLVRRHPHVFGDVSVGGTGEVLANWERIKQQERKKKTRKSALDGVPDALPGLIKAQRVQEKAARVGFDWKDAEGPMEKIHEEIAELKEELSKRKDDKPKNSDRVKEELGDLIFSVCNLARHLKVDAESAVQLTTSKFSRRFRAVESLSSEKGRDMSTMTLQELDALWDAVKNNDT
jgi:ATP diphosphatase